MASKAVLSIALFVFTYLVLVTLAIGLTLLLAYAGFMLIVLKPMFLTIMLGIGIMSVGVFILLFLFKFITKKHKTDRSHLVLIDQYQEPKLFEVINEVVSEVKTKFPKKVYLSYEINAAVFYDSSFWSMFFPVRKNLQIGVGLINSITTSELKAILAHEFGHFSQKSMKVGSYVYNVNQVIYNLLYDNASYNSLLSGWASASNYFHLFAELAAKIISGIQWILKKVYEIVNLNYMALSREMEFHADEVAANVTGPQPVITSLLRLDMADQTFGTVLNYYSERIENGIKTKNMYEQHGWLLNFLGEENNMTIKSGLPIVLKDDISRFNKSKLTIKDQWASHPSTAERVEHLQRMQLLHKDVDFTAASSLLQDKLAIQEQFTEQLFTAVQYKTTPKYNATEEFIKAYKDSFFQGSFNKIYNGYYDNKNTGLSLENMDSKNYNFSDKTISDLFNAEAVDMVYSANSLQSDIELLKEIAKGESNIKTFDYDGQKYSIDDCSNLLPALEQELNNHQLKIAAHDNEIGKYFLQLAKHDGKDELLSKKYATYNMVFKAFPNRFDLYSKMVNETAFIQHTTPFETIENNLSVIAEIEKDFKAEIKRLLEDCEHLPQITPEIKDSLKKYLFLTKAYFIRPDYNDEALDIMFTAVRNYYTVISNTIFHLKKSLLEYQANLELTVLTELV